MGYFNFFDEWAMDPKVQSMSETMQRRHAMLLCLRNIGLTCEMPDEDVATFMRIGMAEARKTKELFNKKGFIDGTGWNVRHWDKRQEGQSESLQRVRKHRAKERYSNGDVTLQGSDSNATETLPRGRADLLTNVLTNVTNKEEPPTPRKRGKPSATADDLVLPSWLPKKDLADWLAHRQEKGKPVRPGSLSKVLAKLDRFRAAGHDPIEILEASIVGDYQGLFAPSGNGSGKKKEPPRVGMSDEEYDRVKKFKREQEARMQAEHDASHARKKNQPPPRPAPPPPVERPIVNKTQAEVLADIERMKQEEKSK